MKYASVASGIEGASAAWEPLGWKCAFVSEIEDFPCQVLKYHFPHVPNRGDMTKFQEWPDEPDLDVLVGGTPCQSFSVAGLRKGLDDPRGDLTLTYAAIAARYRPPWLVWENVPGLLSSAEGRDFAAFLGLLTGTVVEVPSDGWQNSGIVAGIPDAYGVAYRVLDAQFAGVPQRRRRIIVVGYLGDWRPAAAVLLELTSLRGDPPPRREAREGAAARAAGGSGERGLPEVVGTLSDGAHMGGGLTDKTPTPVAYLPSIANPLTQRMHKGINTTCDEGQTLIPVAFKASHYTRDKDGAPSEVTPPLSADADKGDQDTLVFEARFARNGRGAPSDVVPALKAESGSSGKGDGAPLVFSIIPMNSADLEASATDVANAVSCVQNGKQTDRGTRLATATAVRRLTPRECERLQGFPDDWTAIQVGKRGHVAKDGPRYKALGNSFAVPIFRWIGERIAMVTAVLRESNPR